MKLAETPAPNFGTSKAVFFGGDLVGVVEGICCLKMFVDVVSDVDFEALAVADFKEAKGLEDDGRASDTLEAEGVNGALEVDDVEGAPREAKGFADDCDVVGSDRILEVVCAGDEIMLLKMLDVLDVEPELSDEPEKFMFEPLRIPGVGCEEVLLATLFFTGGASEVIKSSAFGLFDEVCVALALFSSSILRFIPALFRWYNPNGPPIRSRLAA